MWIFKAIYNSTDTGEEVIRIIKFDRGNFLSSEKECYIYAMKKAYNMKQENEYLNSLEFVEC